MSVGKKVVRSTLIAIALVISTTAPVAASDKTAVMEVVHRWTDAFGGGTFNTDTAPCSEDAVVIDDLRPHVWQGPGACSRWFKTFEARASKAADTDPAQGRVWLARIGSRLGRALFVARLTKANSGSNRTRVSSAHVAEYAK